MGWRLMFGIYIWSDSVRCTGDSTSSRVGSIPTQSGLKERNKLMQMRYFHCPVCKMIIPAPKHKNFKKNIYKGRMHRKHMYCYTCKKEQRFILDEAFFL